MLRFQTRICDDKHLQYILFMYTMYMYYRFMDVANVWNSADNSQVSAKYQSMIYKPSYSATKLVGQRI